MYILAEEKIIEARKYFRKLEVASPADGDNFFGMFGPGNSISVIDKPYERFADYEKLLLLLRTDDELKYETIHKGTPYYFLAWTAFDLKNYEKAVFYMDAAISEDKRKSPLDWLNNPASQFLTLNCNGNQAAVRITKHLNEKISLELMRLRGINGNLQISIDDFVEKFVKSLVKQSKNHSIITAFYSYILEFEEREKELLLRSSHGGSIEPVLTYLFKGGLIFESLLKFLYPKKDNGDLCKTLNDVFTTALFKSDFVPHVLSSASTLNDIVSSINNTDLITSFNTISQLRNTTGHNLVWDDVFSNYKNFELLYEQQVNAIFYLIQRKFL